jgi:hypothetical protein
VLSARLERGRAEQFRDLWQLVGFLRDFGAAMRRRPVGMLKFLNLTVTEREAFQ